MSIQEQKITEAAIAANGVQSRPDKLTGTAAQNKKVFDALVTAVVKERFNALLDELTGTTAAAQLGITTIPGFSAGNVQTALEQIVQAMQDVTQGSVTDGSITLLKLAAEVTAVALGGAAASHTHGAGDINSGVLDAARLPVLDGTKLGAGSVGTAQLAALSVLATHIAQGAVTAQKIAPGAVTAEKIADKTVGVAQLTNDARFGTELAISTPGSTPDLAWGNALVWVWGTSMTIKLTAAISALLPPNWQTRLFANDPFTFEWEGIGTPVNVAKGQTESATGSIAVPAKKYIDLKKISDSIWIISGTYAERMIYTGTSETPPAGWQPGDIYLRYSV